MKQRLALIGFGEAAQAFARGLSPALAAYDRLTDAAPTRDGKLADYGRLGVDGCAAAGEALAGAFAALSLVTADQAYAAAEAAGGLAVGAFWFDMNSVAPETKRAAAVTIETYGGRYVDVAVMAPVHPGGTDVPLLVSGPHAEDATVCLREIGFTGVRAIEGPVGAASAVKMIRSVMVKGMEALSAECALAADAAGLRSEVIASLDAGWPGADWANRFDYNLERMMVHGRRRAAEMTEVVATLDALGTGSAMSRGTVAGQERLGRLGIAPPKGLDAKLAMLRSALRSGQAA
ncbi:3-hydroxyisobutyrate dehydrogenase-like beta-hydroxyacid dehydrogenase [Sphingopyxis panaciterrae]|uniref:DUF1932 domain-containing protein n=1 Tax=Sphingopyxis panaciterrae TaxID=363841 RepID=UPI001421B740|nr:NAD(P)-dependent oxidoreductase [Sphingopyxis panaciterrae]NIJ37400.1 3-hydroxyisobutyrate dehydrogenase-like beta-hydroxyacid dehydrogenase [Sphingopyxis panaciterrae]